MANQSYCVFLHVLGSDNNHVENILESLKRGRSREEDCMEIFNVERTPHMMDLELEERLWRYHFSGRDGICTLLNQYYY